MKGFREWVRTAAGVMLTAAFVLTCGGRIQGQLSAWGAAEGRSGENLSRSVAVEKSGSGVTPRMRNYLSSSKTKTGPGAGILGGSRLTLLANQSASQMMSAVIETNQGGLIVVDGGTQDDAGHLQEVLKAKGGHVKAWFITHPHSDHVGALTQILNSPDRQITIDNVYFSFAGSRWYHDHEEYRAAMVDQAVEALNTLPSENRHGDIVKGRQITIDNVTVTVMNQPYLFDHNSINNSSVAYKFEVNGKKILFLGDMGVEAGRQLLADYSQDPDALRCDIVQMAHHGQNGVGREVYQAIRPSICLWPTPGWLWDNDNGGGPGSGPWVTQEVVGWMRDLGVTEHYCIKDGDQVIQ